MKKNPRKYVYVSLCHWFERGNRSRLEHEVAVFSSMKKANIQLENTEVVRGRTFMQGETYRLPIR